MKLRHVSTKYGSHGIFYRAKPTQGCTLHDREQKPFPLCIGKSSPRPWKGCDSDGQCDSLLVGLVVLNLLVKTSLCIDLCPADVGQLRDVLQDASGRYRQPSLDGLLLAPSGTNHENSISGIAIRNRMHLCGTSLSGMCCFNCFTARARRTKQGCSVRLECL